MTTKNRTLRLLTTASLTLWLTSVMAEELPLTGAETAALARDTGYSSLIKQSDALTAKATADSQLPDPMVSVGWLNIPVEDFNLAQEPMNQVRVAVKQSFPSGDTLALKRDSDMADADATRAQAAMRRLMVLKETRKLWLEVQYSEAALHILVSNEALFGDLRKVTQTMYSNGKKSLNDVVRSELELQRLNDREVATHEMVERQRAMLARWIGDDKRKDTLPAGLPNWRFEAENRKNMGSRILVHPAVAVMDDKVSQMQAQVSLVRQQYKPAWSVELGYSFRNARRANGSEVSNLASVNASLDLPLFTASRQDKRLAAASTQLAATRDARLDVIASLDAQLDGDLVSLARLEDRIRLHQTMIIPQTREQSEAAMMAYEANRVDFAEVMRARIAVLDSELALRRLQTDRLEAIASIWYLLPPPLDVARAMANSASGEPHEQ